MTPINFYTYTIFLSKKTFIWNKLWMFFCIHNLKDNLTTFYVYNEKAASKRPNAVWSFLIDHLENKFLRRRRAQCREAPLPIFQIIFGLDWVLEYRTRKKASPLSIFLRKLTISPSLAINAIKRPYGAPKNPWRRHAPHDLAHDTSFINLIIDTPLKNIQKAYLSVFESNFFFITLQKQKVF